MNVGFLDDGFAGLVMFADKIRSVSNGNMTIDQDAIARHGVPAKHVLELVEAIGGIVVGEIR